MQIIAKNVQFDIIFEKIFQVLSFSRNSTITILLISAKNQKSQTKFRENETFY